jgi:hypothetical protein
MRDPFSSDYLSANVTDTATTTAISAATPVTKKVSSAITPSSVNADLREFGFEPERYGLGKPRRIVIRGKIARE